MALRYLHDVDRSSAQFLNELDRFCHDAEHVESIQSLPAGELAGLVNYLDDVGFLYFDTCGVLLTSCIQALTQLDRTGQPFRKCLQVLQKICGLRATLPLSYQVSGALSSVSELPVAFGGFCDVFKGKVDSGADVCVKKIRVCATDNIGEIRQAGHKLNSWLNPR